MGDTSIFISMTAHVETGDLAAKVAEVFARAATGLALEGMYVSISLSSGEDEEAATD